MQEYLELIRLKVQHSIQSLMQVFTKKRVFTLHRCFGQLRSHQFLSNMSQTRLIRGQIRAYHLLSHPTQDLISLIFYVTIAEKLLF